MSRKYNSRTSIIETDLDWILNAELPWERFHNTSVLITGGTGMLPSYLALVLLKYRRTVPESGLEIFVLARQEKTAQQIYASYWNASYFHLLLGDVCQPLPAPVCFDYIVHGASPADPRQFGTDPAGVFLPNVLGLYQLLEVARRSASQGVLFLSSGAVYGEFLTEMDTVNENTYGCLDPLDAEGCYAEGKRAGEALCAIWARQYHTPTKIVRISHTFGPSMDIRKDSRSFAEFVRCVVERRDIQLYSDGSAVRSFNYITDCVEGMIRILLLGESGQAYNLFSDSYYSIREIAEMLCDAFPERGLQVVCKAREASDTYVATREHGWKRVDNKKLKALGWMPKVSIQEGFRRTVQAFEGGK